MSSSMRAGAPARAGPSAISWLDWACPMLTARATPGTAACRRRAQRAARAARSVALSGPVSVAASPSATSSTRAPSSVATVRARASSSSRGGDAKLTDTTARSRC